MKMRILTLLLIFGALFTVVDLAAEVQTDDLGRLVELPQNPQRVIALTRAFMDVILEIDGNLSAKVDEYQNKSEGRALPSVGSQSSPNIEAMAALRPDLIIANTRLHASLLEAFESTGAAVFYIDPNAYENDPMTDRIIQLGEILHREHQAREYVNRLDELALDLQRQVAALGYRTGIMIFENQRGMTAAQPTGMFGWFLMRLNIQNVVPMGLPGSNQSTWVPYSREDVLLADPDVVILRSRSNDPAALEQTKREFIANPVWSSLKAVRNNAVYVMSPRIDTGVVGNESALRMVAELLLSGDHHSSR